MLKLIACCGRPAFSPTYHDGMGGTDNHFETAIIGAGPAGLAAAHAAPRAIVFENGLALAARHRDGLDTAEGVGGAGLYSDGKFSFWPSASGLWLLEPETLDVAIRWTYAFLQRHGVSIPNIQVPSPARFRGPRQTRLKAYPSVYTTPEQRMAMIDDLSERITVRSETAVLDVRREDDVWILSDTQGDTTTSEALIWAGGRFGPVQLLKLLDGGVLTARPTRLEVGVRIQQQNSKFFLRETDGIDPKFIVPATDSSEWRTFCCCRDGEVVSTTTAGFLTLSGRGDGPKTGQSNVGFVWREENAAAVESLSQSLLTNLRGVTAPFVFEVDDLSSPRLQTNLVGQFGPEIGRRLSEGLARLPALFPKADWSGTEILGPCLEGVGWYPQHDECLKVGSQRLWVAGDSSGTFRGLVPAFVSGYFAGTMAKASMEE